MVENKIKPYSLLNKLSLAIVLVWVCIIFGSLFWNIHLLQHQYESVALNVASAYFDKDLAFRLWGAKHGGVYAPVTKESPPNPYLSHVPERDIVTPSGKQLTLINPAYMIRQMMTEFSNLTGVTGHLTSLKLLNPLNKPDAWEEKNLKAFDRGVQEVVAFVEVDGKSFLRLMRPFITKKSCLKCHAHQGYKVGDVRGATSISIPMEPYWGMESELQHGMVFTHLLILFIGLGGAVFGYWRIRKNITRHVVLEGELKNQNEFTHKIIESLTHPFFVFDADTYNVKLANSVALDGKPLAGQTCYGLSHNRQQPCGGDDHPCPIALLKETRKAVTVEHVHYDAKGKPRDVEIQCYPLFDKDGKVSQVIEYAVDVSERRNAEREHLKLIGQLQQAQKMEAIGQLSGGVAHDFNNLLTAILGYSELAINRLDGDHAVQGYLKIVHETGQKAAALTRQLLAFSRKQVLETQVLCVDSLIIDMAKMLERLLGETVALQHKLCAEELRIVGDPAQLEQVVMNLAVNARDAMPTGGTVVFETKKISFSEDDPALGEEMLPGEYLQLNVSDTGDGMTEDTKEKLFEPFFTTKDVGKGTGLGLSTVYGIVKQHNSFIYVYSELGVGTTFRLYFPLTDADSMSVSSGESVGQSDIPCGEETIMVLDDEAQIVKFVEEGLKGLGYKVVGLHDPVDALRYVAEHAGVVDMLLTDVIMPGMNGRELAAKIREIQPTMPVVFMSGYTDNVIVSQGVLDDDVQFLPKPLRLADLARKVREVLG